MPSRSKPGSSEPSSSQKARAEMDCLAGAVTTPQATWSGGSKATPPPTRGRRGKSRITSQQRPRAKHGVTLASRVTEQSLHFFQALGVGRGFLSEPVTDWSQIPAFLKFCNFVNNFPLTNDASERAIKRTSDYLNFGGRSEEDLQSVLSSVEASVQNIPDRKSKSALKSSFQKLKDSE